MLNTQYNIVLSLDNTDIRGVSLSYLATNLADLKELSLFACSLSDHAALMICLGHPTLTMLNLCTKWVIIDKNCLSEPGKREIENSDEDYSDCMTVAQTYELYNA
jgi:hypothetical protein